MYGRSTVNGPCVVLQRTVLVLTLIVHNHQVEAAEKCGSRNPPPSASHNWADYTTSSLIAAAPRVAIFPLGSIEQHGPHLPLSTDSLIADAFATAAASSRALRLPVSPFGASVEHMRFPGTLAVSDASLNGLWKDVIASATAAGVRTLVLLNAHGGQSPNAAVVARDVRFHSNPPVLVVVVNIQAVIHDATAQLVANGSFPALVEAWPLESAVGIHAGLVETSLILHLHPDLVDLRLARRFESRRAARGTLLEPHGSVVSYGWEAQDLSDGGAVGDASLATPKIGRAIFDTAAAAIKAIVDELTNTHACPDVVLVAPK
jgi:creatinine amidohydrolase